MKPAKMTSMQRVLTTLSHEEPDRVPLFLALTMHGAKELGMNIREYFSKPQNMVEGQLRLLSKYQQDFIYTFCYAPLEMEAWGAQVIYREDGPPNSGPPLLRKLEDIQGLTAPTVSETPCLLKVLKTIELLKSRVETDVPIVGVVISPFSLPVMQLGFDAYIELIYERPQLFWRLMELNKAFSIQWANAQLAAGATAICYFDPVSSPTIIPRDIYLKTGFEVAREAIRAIKGPTATHLASGRSLGILDDLAVTGTSMVGVSCEENLAELKRAASQKLTILGNLNGIEMRRWTPREAETQVKRAIAQAGPGGGFILGDNHGEIPWQVEEEVLFAIGDAVRKWGEYPLNWVKDER